MSDPPPNERTQRVARNLNLHFDADGRYYSEGYVGSGEHADVFLMRKRRKETTGPERVVVKVLRRWEGEEEEEQWDHYEQLTEKDALEIYRGAAHVVNMIAFAGPDADDPLKKDVKGAEKLSSGCWIYMEWLENGSLGLFLERVNKAKRSLPNRLMWRLFMCMVRMAVAIAWSDVHDTDTVQLEMVMGHVPEHLYFNPDLNSGNMVFGEFVPNNPEEEHRLTPILKMIDLGMIDRRSTPTPDKWNRIMAGFVQTIGEEMFMIIGVGRGSGLDKTLDSDLERIVSRCMASNPDDVPGIRDLFIWVSNGINRDAQWYKDKMPDAEANKMEEDDNIIKFVHEFIINANTIPDTQEQED